MKAIFDECFRQKHEILRANQTPRTVIFNNEGWMRAKQESAVENLPLATTYMGMDRIIDTFQEELIVVTHETLQEVDARINKRRPFEQNRPSFYRVWEDVSSNAPANRFRVIETINTCDGPRSRITNGSYASKGSAEAAIADRERDPNLMPK